MIESITEFYLQVNNIPITIKKGEEYVDVNESRCSIGKTSFSYRDFYKVGLIMDTGKLYYADKWILVDRPAILFSNPLIPYAWEAIAPGKERGMYCIFNEPFLKPGDRNSALGDTPLLDVTQERLYFLTDDTVGRVKDLFMKMRHEMNSEYARKGDTVRCYLHLLVHEAMKMQQADSYTPQKNAGKRTAELFLALLERQFPIDAPREILSLKTANDYATRLSVHVNHLNRVVKSTTGRTTSAIITGRIVQEAIQMLQYTRCTVGEIAHSLGFEEQASFSNFIRKHTGMAPSEHRAMLSVAG